MKLSLWNLADAIRDFQLKPYIGDGAATISGVRFFSEELEELLPNYVYIGRAADAFTSEEYEDAILLVHGYDIMLIENQSMEAVLNAVLSAFDYYNKWESELWASLSGENAIQHMVDISSSVLSSPIAISDSTGRIVAYTKSEGPHLKEEGWRYFMESERVPQSYTSSQIRDSSGNLLSDWTAAPQLYHMDGRICIGAQVVADGETVAAFYMQEFDNKLTAGDVNLCNVFCGVLSAAASMKNSGAEMKSSAAAIACLLDGEELGSWAAQSLQEALGAPPFVVAVVQSATASINIVRKGTLLELLGGMGIRCVCLAYGDDVLCVLPAAELGRFAQGLKSRIVPEHYAIGVSQPFSGWPRILSRYRQALFAVAQGGGAGFFDSRDYALEHLLAGISAANRELELLHPALDILLDYDQKHNTQLYTTLECYLTLERNMSATAQALSLHRNSMKYRIRRIRELTGTDFEDERERLLVMLSYRLMRIAD